MTVYLPAVTSVHVVHDRVVHLTFDDGLEGDIDLGPKLRGPVFEGLRADYGLFCQIDVDDETVVWPGDLDLAPEPLYEEVLAAKSGSGAPRH